MIMNFLHKAAAAGLTAASIAALAPTAEGHSPTFPNGPGYGLVSIASSQTFRLVLFNAAKRGGASCTVQTDLLDAAGGNLGAVTRTLAPGQGVTLDEAAFSGDGKTTIARKWAATRSGTTPLDPAPSSFSLRPQITFATNPVNLCRAILPTFEIVDATTLGTDLVARAIPSDPITPAQALARSIVGFATTTVNDILRLGLVNTALIPTDPCRVAAGFVDADGTVVQARTAILAPGQSLILDQPGGIPGDFVPSSLRLLRPVVLFSPQDSCRGLVPTTEIMDKITDRTKYFIPNEPIIPSDPIVPGPTVSVR